MTTLNDLHARGVSVLASNGLAFDLAASTGQLMCTILAGLAQFERDGARPAPRWPVVSPDRPQLGLSKNTVMEMVRRET